MGDSLKAGFWLPGVVARMQEVRFFVGVSRNDHVSDSCLAFGTMVAGKRSGSTITKPHG